MAPHLLVLFIIFLSASAVGTLFVLGGRMRRDPIAYNSRTFFFTVVTYNLIQHIRHSKAEKPRLYKTDNVLYSLVCAGAMAESIYYIQTGKTFNSISLPLAYLLSSVQFLMAEPGRTDTQSTDAAVSAIADKFSLTPRESEITRPLLRGYLCGSDEKHVHTWYGRLFGCIYS